MINEAKEASEVNTDRVKATSFIEDEKSMTEDIENEIEREKTKRNKL